MARVTQKLSDTQIKSGKLSPGRLSDGGGLYLNVGPTGTKSWVFMWTKDAKRREMGMGAYPEISLSKARGKAIDARQAVAEGRDPIAEKAKEAEPTFAECVEQFLASNEGHWKNEKHRQQWRNTLETYCKGMSGKKVSTVGADDVLKSLQPIWATKNETASRVRGRVERVLDFAKAKGWRFGENPALWRGHLSSILPPRQKLQRGHHAAMGYEGLPAFSASLRASDACSAHALEFLILTASRTGEVIGAKWDEIDLAAKVWTVPAERMKMGVEHRVPLSPRAMDILNLMLECRRNGYVFPGQKKDSSLSNLAMTMLMRRMKFDAFTVHGFRSGFRDWCGDATTFPREIAEAALAHAVGDETERAYRRSDALAKRRKLMDAWDKYLTATKKAGNVLSFPAA
ncbi:MULTISPECIES: tyrosine-type recombinase/integrase [unclassified Rhizobium]|uniref:tyrosine-type recombinase/integrase n=1 Tax=unclassified Rhizobium TaxID=2613769 RepID=UPI001ADA7FE2|nr:MULTISPECIES: site-specific integrase [unclassified Rhizobium]MBO9100349.1 integrase arm-type DNA-binding domain-containing protein [Rhizobium sp. L58/93]MBO9186242.1 integrase arm-type DNA-binding domain-containing protein [Rhizobium sp. E27B/91]QXZ83160.1 integrase arm-type DNA-binding domain-containing protein [Rhizobium sp. K1/93]QXZ89328.1 integrase arm-type DNA-binding domain-containing protein [Rhizobium sp. K15/93]QYA01916.1 integrase arm-type DNA-binding domain-containing protein [